MAQAVSTIFLPAQVHVEEPPHILFDELPEQQTKCTPRNEDSGLRTTPLTDVSTRAACTKLAGVMAAHYVNPPTDLYKILAGGVTFADGVKKTPEKGDFFMKKDVPAVIRGVFNERFRPRSFFRNHLRGKISTLHVKRLVTNYTFDAHLHKIAPIGTTAVSSILSQWIETYKAEYHSASNLISKATGVDRKKLILRAALYKTHFDNPPCCDVNLDTILTREQAEAAKIESVWYMTKLDRLAYWRREKWNKDAFATFFEKSRHIMDVRRLFFNGDPETVRLNPTDQALVAAANADTSVYRKMWWNYLPQIADALHRNVLAQEEVNAEMRVYCPGVRVRASATFDVYQDELMA